MNFTVVLLCQQGRPTNNDDYRHQIFVYSSVTSLFIYLAAWRSSKIVGRINEVTLRRARLVLRWVTVFGRVNHLRFSSIHAGQLSLLPSTGRDMSTGQTAVKLCDCGVKAVMAQCTSGQTTTTTTTTVLRPFVRDHPGEPVPEETLTHPPS